MVRWSIWIKKDVSQEGLGPFQSFPYRESEYDSGGYVDKPIRVIITFTEDGVGVEYFLPKGRENYPYFHVREWWSYSAEPDKNFLDVWIRRNVLRKYFLNGEVEIEIETERRYAYAEYEYGRRKNRLYAYITHQ